MKSALWYLPRSSTTEEAPMRLNGQETFGQLLKRRTLLIPPLVDIRGDAKLLAYIKDRDEAEFDVTELLTKAGFGGNFLIILTERIRGSSHTKGFSVMRFMPSEQNAQSA